MHALVFHEPKVLRLESRARPEIGASSDVLVRVSHSGICGTDLNIWRGRFPAKPLTILGHEAIGTIAAVGEDVRELMPGDLVVIDPTLYCGSCRFCRRGRFNFCDHKTGTEVGVDRDGTHAEYVVLPARFVHRRPGHIDPLKAVFAEPAACVLNNAEAVRVTPEDRVLVVGAGPIGLLWAFLLKDSVAQFAVLEKSRFRLDFAQTLGITVLATYSDGEDSQCLIRGHFGGEYPSLIVDTTGTFGSAGAMLVEKGGRLVLMGFHNAHPLQVPQQLIVSRGITIVGAGDYNSKIPMGIDLVSRLPVERIVSHVISLQEFEEAFKLLTSGSVSGEPRAMKVVLTPN